MRASACVSCYDKVVFELSIIKQIQIRLKYSVERIYESSLYG